MYYWKASLLTHRLFLSLRKRTKLLIGAPLLHVAVAILMGCVIESVKEIKNDTTAYFALSNVMLIFLNALYIFYFSKCNEVFLKEHARGLYSYTAVWAFESIPVYILQIFSSALYGIVIYYWIELNPEDDAPIYYLVTIATISVLGTIMCETVVFLSPSIRQSYISFPVFIFILFYFSSLPIKPSTYAVWMRNWYSKCRYSIGEIIILIWFFVCRISRLTILMFFLCAGFLTCHFSDGHWRLYWRMNFKATGWQIPSRIFIYILLEIQRCLLTFHPYRLQQATSSSMPLTHIIFSSQSWILMIVLMIDSSVMELYLSICWYLDSYL